MREPNQRQDPSGDAGRKAGAGRAGPEETGPRLPEGRKLEERWDAIAREFGLYTITETAHRLGFGHSTNLRARRLTGRARVLAIRRGGTFLYPGFQFDQPAGRPAANVKDVIGAGRLAGWTDEQITFWFTEPNRRLDGRRPVDVIDDEERLLRTAGEDMQA